MKILSILCATLIISVQQVYAESPYVVATLRPIALLVQGIVEEDVPVKIIVDSASDPHLYELSPSAAKELASAKLVVSNGVGLEHWLPKDLKSDRVFELLTKNAGLPETHAWLDPVIIKERILPLASFLCDKLKKDCSSYEKRAAKIANRIEAFIANCSTSSLALRQRKFIGMHNAWAPLAKMCGLEQCGVVRESDKHFIGTRDFAKVNDLVTKLSLTTLVVDPTTDPKVIESLVSDLTLSSVVLDEMATSQQDIVTFYEESYRSLHAALKARGDR